MSRARSAAQRQTAARLSLLLSTLAVATAACSPAPPPALPPIPVVTGVSVSPRNVRQVLERRCVVCHGCYDAPCQLLLSSHAGLERGASKEVVYDTERLTAAQPTRLFIDAHGTAEWRERGFFPVTGDAQAPSPRRCCC